MLRAKQADYQLPAVAPRTAADCYQSRDGRGLGACRPQGRGAKVGDGWSGCGLFRGRRFWRRARGHSPWVVESAEQGHLARWEAEWAEWEDPTCPDACASMRREGALVCTGARLQSRRLEDPSWIPAGE